MQLNKKDKYLPRYIELFKYLKGMVEKSVALFNRYYGNHEETAYIAGCKLISGHWLSGLQINAALLICSSNINTTSFYRLKVTSIKLI